MRLSAWTLVAVVTCPLLARADTLGWTLEQTWRYALRLQEQTPGFPAQPRLAPMRLVSPADLRDDRVPAWPVDGPGDLVWHYALQLPAAELPRKKADVAVEDRFSWSGGGLDARGEHQLRRKGRRLQITTQVALTATTPTATVRGGSLQVQRTFDVKQGRMLQASFRLELTAQLPDQQPVGGVWSGTLEPDQALNLEAEAFHADVQAAVARGVVWLRKQLGPRLQTYKQNKNPEHYKLGRVALPVFALLRAGVEPRELEDAFVWMRAQPLDTVYSVALYLMVVEARSIRRQSLPPVAGTRSVARYDRRPIPDADLAEIQRALAWLLGSRGKGWWSYGGRMVDGVPLGPSGHDGKTVPERGDRSNTQFAILALHSALAAGAEVPAEVWDELLDELLGAQQADGPALELGDQELAPSSPLAWDPRDQPADGGGTAERVPSALTTAERAQALARGWSYGTVTRATAASAYGSMSAAGLSSVAVVREGLRHADGLNAERDRQSLLALRDGLGWLLQHYDVASNPGRGASHLYYYLYSLEKAMDLAGVERLGGHEWWREGAAGLLQGQAADGSWEGQVEATSFALLFLNRATLPARLEIEAIGPVATGDQDPALWDQVAVEEVGKVRARQVLRALLRASARDLKQRLELAEQTLQSMDEAVAPRLLPELLALLESGPKPVRKWAAGVCRELTGSDVVAEIARFSERHEQLHGLTAAGQAEAGCALAVEILREQPGAQLEGAALRTLLRLGGVEGAPELVNLLEAPTPERRQAAWQALGALVGERRPFDPRGPASLRKDQVEAWRAYWEAEGQTHVQREQVRRLLARLRAGADAQAEAALRKIGAPATRQLIDALRIPELRERAHQLLQAITRQTLPPEVGPWLDWWESVPR